MGNKAKAGIAISFLIVGACSGESTAKTGAKKTEAAPTTGPDVPVQSTSALQTTAYNPQRNAYFGDLHIHTKLSFDASIFNARGTPDDVYRAFL